jgi:6-pyruvoyltetrahydropterin/6-carboxytetrahydropterin synthase
MFEISKEFHFEAGHRLCHHDGKCHAPHGHSYILRVHLAGDELIQSGPKTNMLVDFSDVTAIVKPMIERYFDHHWLNDSLATDSPTVEFIARWIFEYLKPSVPFLVAVTLHETATAYVTYRPRRQDEYIDNATSPKNHI